MEQTISQIQSILVNAGGKILLALAVYAIGRLIIGRIMRAVAKLPSLRGLDETVRTFANSFIKALLYVVLVIAVISILGIPMSSVIAVLASAGVTVGMALQGALSNLAGGIMIMAIRPFSVGEFISAAGGTGTVKQITLFYTILATPDGKRITIPNGALMNANIENYSSEPVRRVDLKFTCDRQEDFTKVQEIIKAVVAGNGLVLPEPQPTISLCGATNETLEFDVRPYCKNADYWTVYYTLTQEISKALAEAGVASPRIRIVQESK